MRDYNPSDIWVAFRRLDEKKRPTEEMLADYLRGTAILEMNQQGISLPEMARRLKVLPDAVLMVLQRPKWSLVFAIKFAEAVGFRVGLDLSRQ